MDHHAGMQKTQNPRSPDGAESSRGDTVSSQGERQAAKPRTPNEHDESADSQAPAVASQQKVGRIAHDDLRKGQQDTDKGPVLDATYDKVKGAKN
ncbi:MAG: hypothetical protein JWQ76_18 [Ramlibacter sp.]|nr:hypothetical protein [Ramlibacter sp.]